MKTRRSVLGAIALSLLTIAGTLAPLGCTQQQKINVAQEIVAWTPSVESAVATVGSTVAILDPAAAPIVATATTAFEASGVLLTNAAKAYLANPTAGALATLQTVITSFQQSVNGALLSAAKITNPDSQQKAITAINAVATAVNVIFGLVQSISTKAQIAAMRDSAPIKLDAVWAYMDKRQLDRAGAKYGVSAHEYLVAETSQGF